MVRINPLIATFVLIGVAVMIGVLILNTDLSTSNDCNKVSFSVSRNFCMQSNNLLFKIDNSGVETGILLTVVSPDYSLFSKNVGVIKANEDKAFEIAVPFSRYTQVTPVLGEVVCSTNIMKVDRVGTC